MQITFSNNNSIKKSENSQVLKTNQRLENQIKNNNERMKSLGVGLAAGSTVGLVQYAYLTVKKAPKSLLKVLTPAAVTALAVDLISQSKNLISNNKKQ